ncbi:uncharacterized protein LOC103368812, partial [Stegastes partitus]|uniref:Uncharacterized protein LOC103368812 n=1 Tax=Stegastes partitus TaxID=144197 RepID=A0A9Y4TP90_9TELE
IKVREGKDLGLTTTAEVMQAMLGRSPHRRLVQEAFEVSNSEEEEDEEDESCCSSSSDTLTCSIPEDLEETLNLSDVQSEDMAEIRPMSDVEELQSSPHQISSEVETYSKGSETRLFTTEPGFDTSFGSKNVESGLITLDSTGNVFSPKTVTTESLNTAAIPAAEDQFNTAATNQNHDSSKHETLHTDPSAKSPQAAAAVEDTRLIPSRPITPFTSKRASDEFIEEEVEDRSVSTGPHSDLVSV